MRIVDSGQDQMKDHLYETEVVLEAHTNKDWSVIVTDRRLLVNHPMKKKIESIDLVGDHVVGSEITKEHKYKMSHVVFSLILSVLTIYGWMDNILGIEFVLMLLVAAFGVTVWAGLDEKTVIHIETLDELHSIEIPTSAEYIEQTVSQVISESRN